MSAHADIGWTTHTFNPWWGCVKVSPACEHCYADAFAKRVGHGGSKPAIWGLHAERRAASIDYWREPIKWDAKAQSAGERHRVFCASMADVFEDRRDLDVHRERLWDLIGETPNLDWLLLTKRPQHIRQMVPSAWLLSPRPNVWLGTSTENQKYADERIPHLLDVPAVVHFISAEPLLGPIDLARHVIGNPLHRLSWVIVGGESGGQSRAMSIEWARSLRDQILARGLPLFFKQWGNHGADGIRLRTKSERMLDGRTWDLFPTPERPEIGLSQVPTDALLDELRRRVQRSA